MTAIRLHQLIKCYGQSTAAHIDDLRVGDGEIVSLLGPSGCGKTTTLRIVAGLVTQDSGDLFFGDRNVNDIPPERRNAAMVFQNYALFPHMTVHQNIAFGLEVRKLPRDEIARKVAAALDLVKLPAMGDRLPRQLSGGQQQRIAIARAVATEPDVLLFDEPLSNLDAKLREYMRFELRKLLEELKITTLYVTHDQTEAMVVSDRIVVMDKGSIVQVDTPHNVYRQPASRFVAEFVGMTSFIEGTVDSWDPESRQSVVLSDDGITFRGRANAIGLGEKVLMCVRPESVELAKDSGEAVGPNHCAGIVETAVDMGEFIDCQVRIGRWLLRTKSLPRAGAFRAGDRVSVRLDPQSCFIVAA